MRNNKKEMKSRNMYVPKYLLKITEAVYECLGCGTKQTISQEGNYLKAPTGCSKCDSKKGFKLLEEESEFEEIGVLGWKKVADMS